MVRTRPVPVDSHEDTDTHESRTPRTRRGSRARTVRVLTEMLELLKLQQVLINSLAGDCDRHDAQIKELSAALAISARE